MSTNPQDRQGLTVSQDHAPSITAVTSGHTPGPWEVGGRLSRHDFDGYAPINTGQHHGLAQVVCTMDDEPWGEGEANALLIAAAPELLGNARKNLATMEETARRLERAGMSHHELDLAIDQTRAAIAEAEGLAPSSAKQVAGDSSRDDHNE